MSNHWHHDPLDVAIVNHMLIEDLHLVDEQQNSFKLHCATKMNQNETNKCRHNASSFGVKLCRYQDDLDIILKEMDVIVCHFPQTHDDLLNKSELLNMNAKRVFLIHSTEDERSLKDFAKELARSDFVFFLSDEAKKKFQKYMRGSGNYCRIYTPRCPLQIIPVEEIVEEAEDSDSESDFESELQLLTYCSGLTNDPDSLYNFSGITDLILNMGEQVSWKISTSTEAVKQKIEMNKSPATQSTATIEFQQRTTLVDLCTEDVSEATHWAIPTAGKRRIPRLDLLFAIGSGKPILTNGTHGEIVEELKKFMNIKLEDDITFGILSQPLDHKKLRQSAKYLLQKYLLDIKSANSSKKFIETLIGTYCYVLLIYISICTHVN